MTEQTRTALKELQALDNRIEEARQRIRDFDPLFAEVEEPALVLEGEVGNTRKRLQDMKLEERKLETTSEEKRARVKRLEDRLGSVRNLREEAAVSAELDMVRRALQSDEQEAYTLIDQIRKLDERMEELEAAYGEAQAIVEPRMKDLIAERDAAKADLAGLEQEREQFVAEMEPREVRLYEGIRAGGRRRAVAELTPDGACGHCFGMLPLQVRNEVLHGSALIRCEACGVILAAPSGPDASGETPGQG
jgi:predicted  nucleic acid-binding Zn-ribbon protein